MKQIIRLQKRLLWAKFILFLAGFVVFLGMAGNSKHITTAKDKIIQKLSMIESTYRSENITKFDSCLDNDFPNSENFKTLLQDEFLSKKELEINFIIDSVLTEDNKIFVYLHWFKKYRNLTGEFFKQEGSSRFVFSEYSDSLKLLYIEGTNPFY